MLLARDQAARRPWLLEDEQGRRPAAGEWRTVALQPRADQLLARARSAGVVLARGRARRPLPLDRAVALREGDVLVAPDGRVRILRPDENLF
ncbi:hypothetical protein K8Z61_08580 [Nocardioides sp. TRM66260-LWL]|uniref:hypothetical protein n=1 Tax=Nocardioides sp. TRM66260-LWL TaxID=2874478 RepID=UPI001CC6D027|nr:hypothetical protein [Nocardioides sp. TRM66260-LWL]MBZ5734553.1 hypothetical protein [Nocardioides sp. TRM66260-LWL]